MPNRVTRVGREEPLLDLRGFARPGPAGRVRLAPAQLEQIVRTVSRARGVVVKVSRGATSTAGVIAHLRYIDRNGRLEIETDEGYHLKGKGIERDLTDDWDLDSANAQGRGPYRGKAGRKPVRLVHNVILSMPKGTPRRDGGFDAQATRGVEALCLRAASSDATHGFRSPWTLKRKSPEPWLACSAAAQRSSLPSSFPCSAARLPASGRMLRPSSLRRSPLRSRLSFAARSARFGWASASMTCATAAAQRSSPAAGSPLGQRGQATR